MKTQYLPCGVLRSAAGLAIGGAGFFHLFTHILGATEHLTRTLDQTSASRTQLLSLIVAASSLNTHTLGHDLLGVFWPLLPSFAGCILLWSAAWRREKHSSQPCAQWV
jgi:hypothetical protein